MMRYFNMSTAQQDLTLRFETMLMTLTTHLLRIHGKPLFGLKS